MGDGQDVHTAIRSSHSVSINGTTIKYPHKEVAKIGEDVGTREFGK